MNHLIVIPLMATILFCTVKYIEKNYFFDENENENENEIETYALKYIFRDALVIFLVTLLSNYIYNNIHNDIDNLYNVITETKTFQFKGNTEIFTDTPNF